MLPRRTERLRPWLMSSAGLALGQTRPPPARLEACVAPFVRGCARAASDPACVADSRRVERPRRPWPVLSRRKQSRGSQRNPGRAARIQVGSGPAPSAAQPLPGMMDRPRERRGRRRSARTFRGHVPREREWCGSRCQCREGREAAVATVPAAPPGPAVSRRMEGALARRLLVPCGRLPRRGETVAWWAYATSAPQDGRKDNASFCHDRSGAGGSKTVSPSCVACPTA
jgi:hypothetical protein